MSYAALVFLVSVGLSLIFGVLRIVNVAHGLKKKVVAEGVETEAQAAHLLYIGCNYAQGWLYGKAVSTAEMTAHLRGLSGHSVHPVITPSP